MKVAVPPLLALLASALGCGNGSDATTGPPVYDAPRPADAAPDASADAQSSLDAASVESQPDGAPGPFALLALDPTSAARGAAVSLTVSGSGFTAGAVVGFAGQPVPTTRQSDTRLRAEIPAALTMQPGFQEVAVTNGSGTRSNLANFTVAPPPGWPEVLDFQPDNGAPGDKIRLVGYNLSGEGLMVSDPQGHAAPGGAIGTVNAARAVLEAVEVTVPDTWQSGPLVVTSPVGSFRARAFNVGKNLTRLPGVMATASSQYGEQWTIPKGVDNDLYTSWFTAAGECVTAPPPTCRTPPWFMVTFPAPQTVTRIAIRGYRDYDPGYDFLRAHFEVLGAAGATLWSGSFDLPEPNRDLDVALPAPAPGAVSVRFTSEKDESEDPGFGELEIY